MPRTALTITDSSRAGVVQPTQNNGDATNGHYLPYNDGRILLELNSSSGTTIFTFPIPVTTDGSATASKTVTCTAAQTKVVGPFPPAIYNQADGTMNMDIDNTTLGRIRAYHLP